MQSDVMRELVLAASEVLQPRLKESPGMRRLLSAMGAWLIEECRRAEMEADAVPVTSQLEASVINGSPRAKPASGPTTVRVGHDVAVAVADAELPATGSVTSDIGIPEAEVSATVETAAGTDDGVAEVTAARPTSDESESQATVDANEVAFVNDAKLLEPVAVESDAAEPIAAEPTDAEEVAATGESSSEQPSAPLSQPSPKVRSKGRSFKGKPDFSNVRHRASLMEQACELALQRLQTGDRPPDKEQELQLQIKLLREKIERLNGPTPRVLEVGNEADATLLSVLKSCYGGLKEGVDLLEVIEHSDKTVQRQHRNYALSLLAEVTSMLEEAIDAVELGEDPVVEEAYAAIRWLARKHTVSCVKCLDDDGCGDSTRIDELRNDIQNVLGSIHKNTPKTEVRRAATNSARWRISQVLKNSEQRLTPASRNEIREGLASLSAAGAAGKALLVDAVRSVGTKLIGGMDLPKQQFLAEIEEFRNDVKIPLDASAEAPARGDEDDADDDSPWSEDVARVRETLRGRKLLLVGGTPRPEAKAKLVEAFELAELFWDEIKEHTSAQPLKPRVDDPDTAVVVVMPKFTGHVIADNVQAWCRAAGKPCVMTNGGYNPNGVAHAICKQASVKLGLDTMPNDAGEGI
ncbi:MAG: hypothetical protein ACK4PI_03660 [Tepidisphaerales bacterium]